MGGRARRQETLGNAQGNAVFPLRTSGFQWLLIVQGNALEGVRKRSAKRFLETLKRFPLQTRRFHGHFCTHLNRARLPSPMRSTSPSSMSFLQALDTVPLLNPRSRDMSATLWVPAQSSMNHSVTRCSADA